MTETSDAVRVADAPERQRYEAHVGEAVAGFVAYRALPTLVILTHTEVDPALEGRGVGSALAGGVLDDLKARGVRIVPRCPFISTYIRRHPEYEELTRATPAR